MRSLLYPPRERFLWLVGAFLTGRRTDTAFPACRRYKCTGVPGTCTPSGLLVLPGTVECSEHWSILRTRVLYWSTPSTV